jgi:hypothetical protein
MDYMAFKRVEMKIVAPWGRIRIMFESVLSHI